MSNLKKLVRRTVIPQLGRARSPLRAGSTRLAGDCQPYLNSGPAKTEGIPVKHNFRAVAVVAGR